MGYLLRIFHKVRQWKNSENWLMSDEDMDNDKVELCLKPSNTQYVKRDNTLLKARTCW